MEKSFASFDEPRLPEILTPRRASTLDNRGAFDYRKTSGRRKGRVPSVRSPACLRSRHPVELLANQEGYCEVVDSASVT
jgi:hypothetical protein